MCLIQSCLIIDYYLKSYKKLKRLKRCFFIYNSSWFKFMYLFLLVQIIKLLIDDNFDENSLFDIPFTTDLTIEFFEIEN